MKQATLILFTVFVSWAAYCQKNISLKFSPLALIDDVSFPTIQPGAEYRFSDRFYWYNELGLKYRRSTYDKYWDSSFVTSKGLKIKTELRYYLKNDAFVVFKNLFKSIPAPYLAFNLFYTSDVRNNGVEYYYRTDTSKKRTDVFGASKKIYGFNFLFGKERSIGKQFGIDTYIGAGVRFRRIKTSHQEFDPRFDYWIKPIDVNIPAIVTAAEVKQKKDITGNFSCGIRISYKLYRL